MDSQNLRALQAVIRWYGWFSLALFSFLMVGFVFQWPAFDVGGSMHWMIWDRVADHVAPMLLAVYVVWSVYLIRIARDPLANITFLDFTAWANLAHGASMIPHALMTPDYHIKFFTDIPMVVVPALAWLAVRRSFIAQRPA